MLNKLVENKIDKFQLVVMCVFFLFVVWMGVGVFHPTSKNNETMIRLVNGYVAIADDNGNYDVLEDGTVVMKNGGTVIVEKIN